MPRSAQFQALLDNVKRVKEEAEALGKDPIEWAKELQAKNEQEALDLADVVRVMSSKEAIPCVLCVMELQKICTDQNPSVEARQHSMVGAWTLGFCAGLKLREDDEPKLVEYGCDRHKNDLAVMIYAARHGWPGP
jgi:hypothetical protein